MDIQKIRGQYGATKNHVYLNFGAGGCLSVQVAEKIAETFNSEHRLGSYHPDLQRLRENLFQEVRKRVAAFLNANEAEIALVDNSTQGVNLISQSVDWQPGDEVIISDAEHPGGYLPWINLSNIRGIKVNVVPLQFNEKDFLSSIKKAIHKKTKVICLSHVAWGTGYQLPIKKVACIAKENGIHFLVDGAQGVGQMPVDVSDIGCDSYTISGHKWLMGPMGAGALYVNNESMKKLSYSGAGPFSAISYNLETRQFVPHRGANRFEMSTRSAPLYSGLNHAIKFLSTVGIDRIGARIIDLATRLQRQLVEIPGLILNSPWGANGSRIANSGLVACCIPGIEENIIIKTLFQKYKIIARKVTQPVGCRFSVHFFNTESEIDQVAIAMKEISETRR